MRVRVALRAFWAMWDLRLLFNPFRDFRFSWQFASHKLLRYLAFVPQVAAFVSNDKGNKQAPDVLAERARALGMHSRDKVVRNILMDRSSRLIRAAIRVRAPSEKSLSDYLAEHAEQFQEEPRWILEQMDVSSSSEAQATSRP